MFNSKRMAAVITVTLGVNATLMILLNIWAVSPFGANDNAAPSKLTISLVILSIAFLALLGVMKMMEDKK